MPDSLSPTVAERADYIATACADLFLIADPPRLRMLSYLIDMARLEAERIHKELRKEEKERR